MISYLPVALSAGMQGVERASETQAEFLRDPTTERSRWEEMETLGAACREGDVLAWDTLFTIAWPILVTFVHRLYRSFDLQDAEDIAQAALEAAIAGVSSFTGKGSFRGWLFGIAAKQAASWHRLRSARKRGAGVIVALRDADEACDEARSPAEISAASDRAEVLHRALDQLDETDRDLVHLHFFGDLTFKEIAAIRALNPKTVCTRLTRAKERLLVILGRFNLTNSDG
ncbi:MAG: sigma-70 family RNA polymerase sigma factor [Chthoniobacterales bacterium]|nr:sigma-70 family RNA polymerase sigma factor [Chthoniobacterales bacterium]